MRAWTVLLMMVMGCAPEINEGPLEGPGVDEELDVMLTDASELLVGLTHLQVINAPGPGNTFGEHANAVGNHLFEEEPNGWMGAAFRNEGQLRWWTMTVWESEEDLLDFVVSEPHASAMADFDDIVVGGISRSLWLPSDELPLSWDEAMELLLEDPDFSYGDADWPATAGAE